MNRIQSVDVLRVCAIIAVISIHTLPFAISSATLGNQLDLATVINQAARFAVPFFFILSGYFWACKFSGGTPEYGPSFKMAKRIAFLFFAWSLIYLLPTNIVDAFSYGPFGPIKQIYWNVSNVLTNPLTVAMEGTKTHLWFLMGLLSSLLISAILLRHRHAYLLAAIAILLYAIGLAGKAYSDTPYGFHSNFNFRNGPFFSLIFFVTGYFLQRRNNVEGWFPAGLAIASLGLFLHFAELRMLYQQWGTSMNQDYVIGTYFLGVGVAMMALSNARYLDFPRAAAIGPFVLGIYTSHVVFVDLLRPLNTHFAGNATWSVCYVAAVFIFSYSLVRCLSHLAPTRRLVA